MIWLRSLLFNVAFFAWTLFCGIIFLPFLFLPRTLTPKVSRTWSYGVVLICEHILGLYVKIKGQERLLMAPAIFAAKHQSAWETVVFNYFLYDPSIILKQELMWIPFFGWYLKKLKMVSLSRSKKKKIQDLKFLLKEADQAISRGQSLLIFPEGTRSKPGQKGIYHPGIASLYLHLKIPVVPIAHNAGLFWPRRGFIKYPGQIQLEVLEPIQPGLSRQEFMRILENKIESKTQDLVQKELAHETKS